MYGSTGYANIEYGGATNNVAYTPTISDTVTLSTQESQDVDTGKTETISVTSNWLFSSTTVKTELINLSEVLTTIATLFKSLSDSLSLSDVVSSIMVYVHEVFDSISAVEQKVFDVCYNIQTNVNIVDTLSTIGTFFLYLYDSFSVAVKSLVKDSVSLVTDTVNTTETKVYLLGIAKSGTVVLSESFSFIRNYVHSLLDSVGLVEAFDKIFRYGRQFTEEVTLRTSSNRRLNGLLIFWGKIASRAASWTKHGFSSSSWTKKDSTDTDWTKTPQQEM